MHIFTKLSTVLVSVFLLMPTMVFATTTITGFGISGNTFTGFPYGGFAYDSSYLSQNQCGGGVIALAVTHPVRDVNAGDWPIHIPDASSSVLLGVSQKLDFCIAKAGTNMFATSTVYYDASTGAYTVAAGGGATSYTAIRAVNPEDGQTVATTTATNFEVVGYVSQQDFVSGMYVQMRISQVSLLNQPFTATSLAFIPSTFTFPISGPGVFTFNTQQTLSNFPEGSYRMTTIIQTPGLLNTFTGFNNGSQFQSLAVSTTTYFTLGAASAFDVEQASSSVACTFGFGFNFSSCLSAFLTPQLPDETSILSDLEGSIFGVVPWGYALRAYAILEGIATTTATSSLPTLIITFPAFFGISKGYTVDLTPWGHLLGDGSMLSAATNPDTGHTLKQITSQDWTYFVYFLFMMYLIYRIFGLFKGAVGEATKNSV